MMGNLVTATAQGVQMDTGTSPCPWRVVQLWDRSPGQDISIHGSFGAWIAKLQCGKGMLDRDL